MKILGTESVPARPTQLKQITLACYACLCFTTADYLLQGNEKRSNIACLPFETICHRLIRKKFPFLFLSFPDSYFVGPSSSVRAKLEPRGVLSNADVRGLFFWSFRASTHVSPRGKSSWKLRLFLKNYSWYYRNTRIVDSQKTKEDFGLFQIKIMPRFCAVFSTASLKPYANLRLSFRELMTATLPYRSVP